MPKGLDAVKIVVALVGVGSSLGGCSISPIIVSHRGMAVGLYQRQSISEGDSLKYDRIAGVGVAAWDGALSLGYTDRASLWIDINKAPVVFRAPKMRLGTNQQMEVLTGAKADVWAGSKGVSALLADPSASLLAAQNKHDITSVSHAKTNVGDSK